MTTSVTFKTKDESGEPSTVGFRTIPLTSANYDNMTGVVIPAIVAAFQGVSLCPLDGLTVNAIDTPAGSAPVDPYAQRESKWRVTCISDDSPPVKTTFEIAGADLTLKVAGTQFMNIAAGAGATLVTQIETNLVSQFGGALTVQSIKHVGRNV